MGKFTGHPYIWWQKPWFPVKIFPTKPIHGKKPRWCHYCSHCSHVGEGMMGIIHWDYTIYTPWRIRLVLVYIYIYMLTWLGYLDGIHGAPYIAASWIRHGDYYCLVVTGTMEFNDFPFSWECHHPNWRTHIFQRARSTTNQMLVAPSWKIQTMFNYVGLLSRIGIGFDFQSLVELL